MVWYQIECKEWQNQAAVIEEPDKADCIYHAVNIM